MTGRGAGRRVDPRRALTLAVVPLVWLLLTPPSGAAQAPAQPPAAIPARLTDAEFWRLIETLSEPNGYFRSDNLVSNEDSFQTVIPALARTVKPGGVYLGVGPDQNFTYITALQPKIAFILDIRRGNLLEHLMYKALIELSADRADFLSRLFSRKRPAGLDRESTPQQLFAAYAPVAATEALYDANILAIVQHLRTRHKFALSDDDVAGIAQVYMSFYSAGPYLAYSAQGGGGRPRYPSYQDLQMAHDGRGRNHAYLGSEANYLALKSLEERNLIVPVVGNFAGPTALRAIGGYVKSRGATVTTFYLSNVEQYLFQDGIWQLFARNVAQLPLDGTSTFIRSCFTGCVGSSPYPSRAVMQIDSIQDVLKDFTEGRILSYPDLLARVR
jgi:hypothetical protein